jgi:hypothetical protein
LLETNHSLQDKNKETHQPSMAAASNKEKQKDAGCKIAFHSIHGFHLRSSAESGLKSLCVWCFSGVVFEGECLVSVFFSLRPSMFHCLFVVCNIFALSFS